MQRGELRVVCRAVRRKYESLGDGRTAVTADFKEYRLCLIRGGLLHHGYFFGRTAVRVIAVNWHKAVHARICRGRFEIDKPPYPVTHGRYSAPELRLVGGAIGCRLWYCNAKANTKRMQELAAM